MSDRRRQWLVTAGAVFMVFGTLYGFGLIGTPVEQSAGGSLSAEATLLAPAVRAFSIWSVIYLGLIGYVVWQWLPANTASPRARRIGWLSSVSMALNGLWLLVVQAGALWLSVAVIVALAATLGELMRRLGEPRATGAAERLLVDGTFGLYLGWVSVATLANVTATLVASGVDPGGEVAEYLAVAVLGVGAALGAVLAKVLGGRLGVAAAMVWGLSWIAVGRLTGEPASDLTGVAAAIAAAVVAVAAALVLLGRHTELQVPETLLTEGNHAQHQHQN
ncbi:MAG: tryptophan-rich sensory protein [Propionibacteriaceae bacterium]|nr:tryptophan-rich sensory protein [Propionibacteriaceae bacterium]